jgi:PAS domain S-box-containing protein
MEQKNARLGQLIAELRSTLLTASPEIKEHLAAELIPLVEQQLHATDRSHQTPTTESDPGQKPEPSTPSTRTYKLPDVQKIIREDNFLNQITENLEHVVWLRDIRTEKILYVSPAFEKVWGLPCESLYSDPLILINSVHPEDRLQVMVARPHLDHKSFNQAFRILRPDDSLRWIFARTFVLHGTNDEQECLFCIAQDITNQKQIESALRKTLDRTQEQFDLSRKMSLARKPEAVLRTVMSANELRPAHRAALLFFENPKVGAARGIELVAAWQASQEVPGWAGESSLYEDPTFLELFQQNRTVIIPQVKFDPRLTPAVRDFLLEGQIQTVAIFPMVASGNWLGCLLVYFKQEHRLDRNELRHLKVLVDQATITLYNLQLLEVEEESRHEAERANEIKTKFLAMISHELRTPLTSIVGFTTTLLAEDVEWEPGEQRDFFQTIQLEASRLQELIDHLLDLSRLEAGMLPVTLSSLSPQEILKDASSQFHSLTGDHQLTVNLPANLPMVYGDAKRIAQVLVNLVRNATTYAPKGTEVNISANVRGNFLQISVSDQGPGIPISEKKKVFQAFRRGKDIETRSPQGAGLGLAICKGLVEAQGGRIWIKKKSTPGATICFTIPLAPLVTPVNAMKEEG